MYVLCTGAAGFIGTHLIHYLKSKGYWIRGVDLREPTWNKTSINEFHIRDLRCDSRATLEDAYLAMKDMTAVYALAADMGGIGYITSPSNQACILENNARIALNTLEGARRAGVRRLLFTSSVCIYPVHRLTNPHPPLLMENDAYPAMPQETYGWEKLYAEKLYTHYRRYGLKTRIVRLETTYGPGEKWRGGKEKAPAALCRKVAISKLTEQESIEIWGDGKQTRTYMYVDDCLRGLEAVMESDCQEPVNLGPDESVSIDELADLIMDIAGVDLKKVYVEGPQGVRGRNFSHERAKSLGWSAQVSLRDGMTKTYEWIEKQVEQWLQSGMIYSE